jgi:predicted glycoside hydrolase/deacetylase ChbG (UPF0249 family)
MASSRVGTVAALAAAGAAWLAPAGEGAEATLQERMGHPATARLLILHADDLGMAQSVNRATHESLERGWINSASILVPCPWFPQVVRWARAHPEADLGIHLALTSEWTTFRWRPLTAVESVPSLMDPDGYLPLVETTVAQRARPEEAEKELRAQIERARAAGIRLTHLDSHMNALYGTPGLLDVYVRLGREYRLPIRLIKGMTLPAGASVPASDMPLDSVVAVNPGVDPKNWQAEYERLLKATGPGLHLLVLHLADADAEMWGATGDHPDWGAAWRQYDVDLVKSPTFQAFLKEQGFVVVTWNDVRRAMYPLPR